MTRTTKEIVQLVNSWPDEPLFGVTLAEVRNLWPGMPMYSPGFPTILGKPAIIIDLPPLGPRYSA